MNRDNICKFNLNLSSDLLCLNFIRETQNSQAVEQLSHHYVMYLVMDGAGVLRCEGREYTLNKGTLFFTREGNSFAVMADGFMEYCYITFHGRRADELLERFHVDSEDPVYEGYEGLIDFWNNCQEKANDSNIDVLCESVLLYSFSALPAVKKETNDAVSKVISLVQKNFNRPSLSITEIAEEIGYASKYLSSLFKKKKGVSFTAYLREMRIKHALFLMEQGVVSVKNVALLSGFGDALYFSKIFTAEMGISPKAYIQKLGER